MSRRPPRHRRDACSMAHPVHWLISDTHCNTSVIKTCYYSVGLNASAGFSSRIASPSRLTSIASTEQFGINPRARSPSSGQCRLKIDRIRSEWQTTAAGPLPPSASSPRNRSTRRRARTCGSQRDHHRRSHRAASTRSIARGRADLRRNQISRRPRHRRDCGCFHAGADSSLTRSKISNTPTAAPNESRPATGPAPSSRTSGSSTSGLSIPSVAINAVCIARVSGEA